MALLPLLALFAQAHTTCLAFISENLANGNGNWYTYFKISDKPVSFKAGDKLEYDLYLDPKNPTPKGGLDVEFSDGSTALRDVGVADQNGLRAHGDALLAPAVGKWYHREISMDAVAGKTSSIWNLVFEGDEAGVYVQFVDNIDVLHSNGTRDVIYNGGLPPFREVGTANGYTRFPACEPVEKSEIGGAQLDTLVQDVIARSKKLKAVRAILEDADALHALLPNDPHISKARGAVQALETKSGVSQAEVNRTVASAKAELALAKPALAGYMAYLVGYAHIDLQWLWEWQEAMVASRDTFRQAIKFMDEVPGFRFSQSSSAHFKAIEDNYPELFAQIKEKVASGQLEIVGGRVCEADTNVIGPESHARQFLYGQRYFRERFGKTAVVGWEPDTFGHTWQMPQILKLGGCRFYYFCRGGKGQPLFWWQGLDGSKVLAFDDTAAGSWYNSSLSGHQFEEMASVAAKTGSKDLLVVYGVGNHGGGPTREELREAARWKSTDYLPDSTFAKAHSFFTAISPEVQEKAPVINQELNPVFEGCYSSHAEIKQSMRNAENWTSTAESVSSVASMFGFHYPQSALRKNWETICTNQHHDSMGGSGIHSPYVKTKLRLDKVALDDQDIAASAMETLVQRVTPKKNGLDVLVFNPTGWVRSGWSEVYLVQSGWSPDEPLDPQRAIAYAPDGSTSPVDVEDPVSHRARFWAANVPSFGYRVFHIANASASIPAAQTGLKDLVFENNTFIAEFDRTKGYISRLTDKKSGRTITGQMGRLEVHHEMPGGMSAWTIGKIDQVDALPPLEMQSGSNGTSAYVKYHYKLPDDGRTAEGTIITQTFRMDSVSDQITCDVDCDWTQVGTPKTGGNNLRLAFETDLKNPSATYEIPFGAITRPLDGQEWPTQKWMDLGNAEQGLTVLNDSKYGASATASTMRLTLIRSSYDPDPLPNPGPQHWRYAVLAHPGTWQSAGVVRKAAEFNQPLLNAIVPIDATGTAPLEWSLCSFSDPNVVATALKRGEDGDGLIVRAFESVGSPSKGNLVSTVGFAKMQRVNFVEDPLAAVQAGGKRIPFTLHPFEIGTLKLKKN